MGVAYREYCFPELTADENEAIVEARSNGYAVFFPASGIQARNTLEGARRYLEKLGDRIARKPAKAMHLLRDIDYWLPGHGPYVGPSRLRKYHDPVDVISGPFPLVSGEGMWGESGSGTGYLVRTHHGHEIIVNANLLSDHPLCHNCGEPNAGLDGENNCPQCRDVASV